MSGVTPQGHLFTLRRDYPLTSWESILFLCHLRRKIGTALLAIWDGASIHRSEEMQTFLAQGGTTFVHLEHLPPYAPDLNPDEGVWQQLKNVELCRMPLPLHFAACGGNLRSSNPFLRRLDWNSDGFSFQCRDQ